MNDDENTVVAAYQDNIKKLFGGLLEAVITADGKAADIEIAEQRFAKGLALAREAKDRALKLVQISTTNAPPDSPS